MERSVDGIAVVLEEEAEAATTAEGCSVDLNRERVEQRKEGMKGINFFLL